MAARGLCSRREADEYIQQGQVIVDGQIVDTLGTKVNPDSSISLAPVARRAQRERVTVLLNKPIGYVSGTPEGKYPAAATAARSGSLVIISMAWRRQAGWTLTHRGCWCSPRTVA
jgi:23S rRNA pseudouridine2604 synthase